MLPLLETTRLAFPARTVRAHRPLDSFFAQRSDEPERTIELRAPLAESKRPGTLVLVTHMVNIAALIGEGLGVGEALVVRPAADGGVRVVGRLGF